MKRSALQDSHCTLAKAAAELVDAWTFVILREISLGNRKFEAIRRQSGMSPRSLSIRLKHLVEREILYVDDGPRAEYRFTPKAEGLWPVLVALKQWGDAHFLDPQTQETPLVLRHKECGHELILTQTCAQCGEPVGIHSAEPELSPAWKSVREELAKST